MNLGSNVKLTVVSNAVVAGTTNINCTEIDMLGYEGVLFIVQFGAITAGAATTIKAQQDTATGMGSAADLEGTAVTVADDDDDQAAWIDLYKPRERFVRCVITRATQNSVVESAIAIQYKGKKAPITHDATTILGGETHISPAEGTA